jgi:anti-sigma-K factor RskA
VLPTAPVIPAATVAAASKGVSPSQTAEENPLVREYQALASEIAKLEEMAPTSAPLSMRMVANRNAYEKSEAFAALTAKKARLRALAAALPK